MLTARRARIAAATLIAVGSLLWLARLLPAIELQGGIGRPPRLADLLRGLTGIAPPTTPVAQLPAAFWTAVRLLFWTVTPVSLLYALVSREARRLIFLRLALLAFATYALLLLVRAFAGPAGVMTPEAAAIDALQAELEATAQAAELPAALTNVLAALFMMALAALLVGVWRRIRPKPAPAPAVDQLARQAHAALDALHAGADLPDVIARCYQAMADTVARERGLARPRPMTAREFAGELVALGLPPRPVETLTHLFETVRYGTEKPGPRDERAAVDSLRQIVAACAAPPRAGHGGRQ